MMLDFFNGLPPSLRDWYRRPDGLADGKGCPGDIDASHELFLPGTQPTCASPLPPPVAIALAVPPPHRPQPAAQPVRVAPAQPSGEPEAFPVAGAQPEPLTGSLTTHLEGPRRPLRRFEGPSL